MGCVKQALDDKYVNCIVIEKDIQWSQYNVTLYDIEKKQISVAKTYKYYYYKYDIGDTIK
jgi:hypothetical protein